MRQTAWLHTVASSWRQRSTSSGPSLCRGTSLSCQGEDLSLSCQGEDLSLSCQGEDLSLSCQGEDLSLSCQGEDLSLSCQGEDLSLSCQGEDLSLSCQGEDLSPRRPVTNAFTEGKLTKLKGSNPSTTTSITSRSTVCCDTLARWPHWPADHTGPLTTLARWPHWPADHTGPLTTLARWPHWSSRSCFGAGELQAALSEARFLLFAVREVYLSRWLLCISWNVTVTNQSKCIYQIC